MVRIDALRQLGQCSVLKSVRDESEELMGVFLPVLAETFLDFYKTLSRRPNRLDSDDLRDKCLWIPGA